MLKMKKRTERKRVDWGAGSQKEDKEQFSRREGGRGPERGIQKQRSFNR